MTGAMIGASAASQGGTPPDITPSAVNWANVSGVWPQANANQTINGITSSISVSATYSGDVAIIEYRINSGSYVTIGSGVPFNVSNGQTLNFRISGVPLSGTASGTITVRNESSSSATLDTFTYTLTET